MSRTLSSAALVALVLLPIARGAAQERTPGRTTTEPGRVTLRLKRPAWFGFALECRDCAGTSATTGAARRARDLPVIARVWPDGPAARASLQMGDTIVTADGKALSAAELREKIERLTPGASLQLLVGGRRGRSPISIVGEPAQIEAVGRDTLPVRYHGEFAEVTVDVLTMTAPVVTRDSTGAMLIRVGDHIVRLHRGP